MIVGRKQSSEGRGDEDFARDGTRQRGEVRGKHRGNPWCFQDRRNDRGDNAKARRTELCRLGLCNRRKHWSQIHNEARELSRTPAFEWVGAERVSRGDGRKRPIRLNAHRRRGWSSRCGDATAQRTAPWRAHCLDEGRQTARI